VAAEKWQRKDEAVRRTGIRSAAGQKEKKGKKQQICCSKVDKEEKWGRTSYCVVLSASVLRSGRPNVISSFCLPLNVYHKTANMLQQ
jgi:hypothetical protein